MTNSPNPPIFVWYNAFNPQQHSSQHNIHLEKASVLFNLGALCTNIGISCNLTTNQGRLLAEGALNDASFWFFLLLKLEAEKASATMDLSVICVRFLRETIIHQLADFKYEGPRSRPRSRSDLSSFYGRPVAQHYHDAYDMSVNDAPCWIPGIVTLNPCFKMDVKHHAWTFSAGLALSRLRMEILWPTFRGSNS
ncbi:hypothetical protein PIB30_045896 [Stylosanthes scabra]|uniref:BRO1 domain-containing protein n=1 Tax=Stylosanthes scabra TaxID=79078 RepID=A0ABU6UF20_9FABA|nr:hypothetical protein [Stylosanthes scabra]